MGFGGQNQSDTFFLPIFAASGVTADGTRFLGICSGSQFAAEVNCQTDVNFSFRVRQQSIRVITNAKTADTIICVRDDAANVLPITVPTITTGRFVSALGNVQIVSGSLINVLIDTSLSAGSLNFSLSSWLVWCER